MISKHFGQKFDSGEIGGIKGRMFIVYNTS